jgi:hypothetical protein
MTRYRSPYFTGTSDPDVQIFVYADGLFMGGSVADDTGHWRARSGVLPDGVHEIAVRAVDQLGNMSAQSASTTVIIDATAPATPSAPILDPSAGGPTDGDVTGILSATVTGSDVEPNATVGLYLDGVKIGTTTADGSGAWRYTVLTTLPGDHTVAITATDPAGNVSLLSAGLDFSIT